MKKIWKWIIGIVLGLIVLAVLVGAAFMVRSNFHADAVNREVRGGGGWGGCGPGMMPFGGPGWHMRGYGMMGGVISPLGGFLGGLISLGLLALVVLGIIWLVRSLRKPLPVVVSTCGKCGNPVQPDWNNCPNCGNKL
jgi:hypothetical protein